MLDSHYTKPTGPVSDGTELEHLSGPNDDRSGGGWWRGKDGEIWVRCPRCGVIANLEHHEVEPNGNVTPSVECPDDCGFYEHITLKGMR